MISGQIIQEALIRLKRSGQKHIFLSESSISQLDSLQSPNLKKVEPLDLSKSIDQQSSLSHELFESLPLSIDAKDESIIILKEALAKLNPNEKLLFGKGSFNPQIVFLCEYPSAEEFQNNSLCVGKANDLMEKIIKAMGVDKDEIYFTSVIKSKSLSNALLKKGINCPELSLKKVFIEYLKKELSVIDPTIIVSLGESTFSMLMDENLEKNAFNSIRGRLFQFADYPMVPTLNPSYLLLKDSLETKRLFWEDLLFVMNQLKLEITEKQKNYFKKQ